MKKKFLSMFTALVMAASLIGVLPAVTVSAGGGPSYDYETTGGSSYEEAEVINEFLACKLTVPAHSRSYFKITPEYNMLYINGYSEDFESADAELSLYFTSDEGEPCDSISTGYGIGDGFALSQGVGTGLYYIVVLNNEDEDITLNFSVSNIEENEDYITEYDDDGNLIYEYYSDGDYWYEYTYTYYYDGIIKTRNYEDSNGYWEKSEYDSHGNKTYSEGNDEDGQWSYTNTYTYDSNGYVLTRYYESSSGYSYTRTYTYTFYDNGLIKTEYAEDDDDGYWYKYTYTYYANGNIEKELYEENDYWSYREYDEDEGYCTYYTDSYETSVKPTLIVNNTSTQSTTIKSTTKSTAKPTTTAVKTTSVAQAKSAAQKAMKQAKIKKLTAKSNAKKKVTVSWKKVSKAKGYQVQVATSKKFKKTVYNKLTTKKKLTIKSKKLKSGKTYYVRVRAYAEYKDTKGKTQRVYSAWNKKLRKVKVK